MCGIFGYLAYGAERPSIEDIAKIARASESRGTDASGIAWECPEGAGDRIRVVKYGSRAKKFLKPSRLKNFLGEPSPRLLIGHTRSATQGHPYFKQNNHPLFNKTSGTVLIHNGCVINDDDLFKQFNLERHAKVDSEALLRLWDFKDGSTKDKVQFIGGEVLGSYAVAVLSSKTPGELILFCHDNPISMWWHEQKQILWFASTEEILRQSVGKRAGPLPWMADIALGNNTWVHLKAGGETRRGHFKAIEEIFQVERVPEPPLKKSQGAKRRAQLLEPFEEEHHTNCLCEKCWKSPLPLKGLDDPPIVPLIV